MIRYKTQRVELRHELHNVAQFHSDYQFLKDNGLRSTTDIDKDIQQTWKSISALTEQRSKARNRVRHETDPQVLSKNKAERAVITAQIKPLRRRIKRLHGIHKDTPRLLNLLKTELRAEYEIKHPVKDKQKLRVRSYEPER